MDDDGTSTTDSGRPVWLQRWELDAPPSRSGRGRYVRGIGERCGGRLEGVVETDGGYYPPSLPQALAIAQAPSMLRLLLLLEHAGTIPRFVNDGDNIFDDCSEPCCPCCRCEVVGHNAGCELDADLTACGLVTAALRDEARAAIKAAGLWP